jgi:hypothetical protein
VPNTQLLQIPALMRGYWSLQGRNPTSPLEGSLPPQSEERVWHRSLVKASQPLVEPHHPVAVSLAVRNSEFSQYLGGGDPHNLESTGQSAGTVYSARNLSVPIHNCASPLRFALYLRVTVYSFPPLMRSPYSPVDRGSIPSTNDAFTSTDR